VNDEKIEIDDEPEVDEPEMEDKDESDIDDSAPIGPRTKYERKKRQSSPAKEPKEGEGVKYRLCTTNFNEYEQGIKEMKKKFKGQFSFVDQIEDATHLLIGETKRTMKVLGAIAKGIPIIKAQWVLEMVSNGVITTETEYYDDTFPNFKVSMKAQQSGKKLLEGKAFFVDDETGAPQFELEGLIVLAGGKVLENMEGADYCISPYALSESDKAEFPDLICVDEKWLTDSIASYEILDNAKFLSTEEREESDSPKKKPAKKKNGEKGGKTKKGKKKKDTETEEVDDKGKEEKVDKEEKKDEESKPKDSKKPANKKKDTKKGKKEKSSEKETEKDNEEPKNGEKEPPEEKKVAEAENKEEDKKHAEEPKQEDTNAAPKDATLEVNDDNI